MDTEDMNPQRMWLEQKDAILLVHITAEQMGDPKSRLILPEGALFAWIPVTGEMAADPIVYSVVAPKLAKAMTEKRTL